ncbi:MAG: FKBP-type peptidyl-prolyl cis-trans isomerase [Spirochaetes bacterium]|nr:FKBP-type peptidyl-prolyl cis-trans isomerase [Spirochaetota bacterium]
MDAALGKARDRAAAARTFEAEKINARWPGLVDGRLGLRFRILEAGSGARPTKGALVTVEYKGMLTDGRIFDRSDLNGKPFEFELGTGQVIPGWDLAIQEMRLGEKRVVAIPPELAYGPVGMPGVIPGNAFLVFEMKLTSVK